MLQFVFCGFLTTFFAYLSQFKGKRHFLILSLAIIAYVMGLQDGAAIDFPGYVKNFEDIMTGQKDFGFLNLEERHTGVIEVGWYTLNWILGNIIYSYHFVSFVVSIFICCTIYKVFQYVDKKWYWLSILFFYFINMQFCMSGVRQAVSMMCFMLVVISILESKWKQMLIFATLGLTFHNSFIVILCITPIIFIPDQLIEKHIKKIVFLTVILYGIIILQSDKIRLLLIGNFLSVMEESASDYDHYFESIMLAKASFLNTIFRLLNFAFIVTAFYYSKAKERKIMLLFLLSTFAIAIVGENSDVARINNYFTIFALPAMCIIPSVIKNHFLRTIFILLTIVYITKVAIDNTNSFLYQNYNDFHTILF